MLNVLLYIGANTLSEANPAYSSLPQPILVVMHLIQPYLNRGHHVYMDRYYTSVPLTQALLDTGTHFTGTCMKSRVTFRLQGDEIHTYRAGAHLCVAWQAAAMKKPVLMLSTSSPHQMVTVRSWHTTQLKPVVVDRYK